MTQEQRLENLLSKYNNSQFLIEMLNIKFTDLMLLFRPESGFQTFIEDYKKLVQTHSRNMNDVVISRYFDMKLDHISQIMSSGIVKDRGGMGRWIFFPNWESVKHQSNYLQFFDKVYFYNTIDESGMTFNISDYFDDIGAYSTMRNLKDISDDEFDAYHNDDKLIHKNAHMNNTLSDFDRLFHWSFVHFVDRVRNKNENGV